MSKICGIISGGMYSPLKNIDKCDYVIACDKGYEYALREDIRPDYLLGDFDSYTGELPADIKRLDLPCAKDDTDTMVAFKYAVSEGFDEIYLYCALGGRVDHFMGNLSCCIYAVQNKIKVTVIDDDNTMFIFGNSSVTVPEKPGFALSVVSLTDKCENLSIKGTRWELDNVTEFNSIPFGISNEWNGTAEISVGNGAVAVIISKK